MEIPLEPGGRRADGLPRGLPGVPGHSGTVPAAGSNPAPVFMKDSRLPRSRAGRKAAAIGSAKVGAAICSLKNEERPVVVEAGTFLTSANVGHAYLSGSSGVKDAVRCICSSRSTMQSQVTLSAG